MIEIRIVTGGQLRSHIADLARLRIEVFREYPYLYDGTLQYEEAYLKTYTNSPQAMAVLASENGRIIGASTGIPMLHETDEFKEPFLSRGIDPATLFYCGESVLDKEYRGRGIYRHFWSRREEYAHSLELTGSCFCAVVRPADHPLRPPSYQSLDAVWTHFGYTPEPGLTTWYPWKDIDQVEETPHLMQFWLKELTDLQTGSSFGS